MCYPKPGPRCSNHALINLNKATNALNYNPNDPVLRKEREEALTVYYTTPAGIKKLRVEGKNLLADVAEQKRKAQIAALLPRMENKTKDTPEQAQLRADAYGNDDDARIKASEHPNLPADVLTGLVEDSHWVVRYNVAQHPNTTPETLLHLARVDAELFADGLAYNPNTPTEALTLVFPFAKGKVHTQGALATNPNTSGEVLNHLTRTRKVRSRVADNPNTPPATLTRLAKDDFDDVRGAVAQNPSTPIKTLNVLADDGSRWIRGHVASNTAAPVSLLLALTTDEDKQVSEQAHRNILSRSKPELVEVLKPNFPEVTEDMPREWLVELVELSK